MNTDIEKKTNSHIFTNRDGNTLIKEFEGILQHNPQIKNLDAVIGFLRASGYFSLRPFLNNINKVRILIGIDVDKYIATAFNQGKLFQTIEEEKLIKEFQASIHKDIENSAYQKHIEEGIFQMLQDLIDKKIELRAHPSKKIHAKIYLLYPENFNQYTQAIAITGSSNLSGNGLGIAQEKQYEFNVKITQHEDVLFAKNEFELLWEEAYGYEITPEDLKIAINNTYLKGNVSPYELYIKMLMEYFSGRILETDSESPFELPEGYTKYEYQMDAVIEGYQKLIRYDGFFLADVVGLGKTVIATMIAKKFLIENGKENTKILIVYPPAVEQNWKATFNDFGIDKYTKFVSNGSLSKILDEENNNYWNAEEYDLILIDEAHKFRNNTSTSFTQLQEICKMPRLEKGYIPGFRKKIILISATPINNSPLDLYNEILLFQDSNHCTIDGVGNLETFFLPLINKYKKLRKDSETDTSEFKLLAEKVRDRVINPITVRRTRTDIESISRYNKDINGFPKVEKPIGNRYELNHRMASLFEKTMQTLSKELTYARFQAIAFLRPEASNGLYENAKIISSSLAKIKKHGLVKRLESSFYAFQISINNFRQTNQYMLDMFANDKIFIAPDLNINNILENMTEEEIEELLNEKAKENPKNAIFKATDFQEEFILMLKSDQAILEKVCKDWQNISDEDDSKFAKFKELLDYELFNPNRNPEQKLVVFSESKSTIEYLQRRINRSDVLAISSDNRNKQFNIIRENFDANYKRKLNNYNIILTTDVLAEGVNLHRSNIIVNYDTPWNSTRLMQRIGRVNRIGSSSKHIYNYVFYPSKEGNKEINLNQIAISKIQTFHSTYGEDNQIYSEKEIIDNVGKLFNEALSKDQPNEINQEIPYYEELRSLYYTNRKEYNRIAKLSIRSRTCREPRIVNGTLLSNKTLVFIKTNFRKVFFLVSENVEEISVLDALKYFKALADEKPKELIKDHHLHIEKASNQFQSTRNKEIQSMETSRINQGNMTIQKTTAIRLLSDFMRGINDNELYIKIAQLKSLVEQGTITTLVKSLQRIQKKLRKKTGKDHLPYSYNDALAEITQMAQYYAPYYLASEVRNNPKETNATIILSESFK